MVRGLSDLQVGCMKYWSHPAPLVVPLFHCGGEGESPWNMFPPPSPFAVAGFLQPLLGIWKSLENLKKKIFEEFVYCSPALGSHSQEEGKGEWGTEQKVRREAELTGKVRSMQVRPHQPA